MVVAGRIVSSWRAGRPRWSVGPVAFMTSGKEENSKARQLERWDAAKAARAAGDVEALLLQLEWIGDDPKDLTLFGLVARGLKQNPDHRAIEPLARLLGHDDRVVRGVAASSLSTFRGPAVFAVFVRALGSPHPVVREYAAIGLGNAEDARAEKPLVDSLADPEWQVRQSAAVALGKIGGPRAIEPLKMARSKAPFWRRGHRKRFTDAVRKIEGRRSTDV
jgi:HEAT repeat protein